MPSPRTRLSAAVLAAALLLAPVAGCGGDSKPSGHKASGTSSGTSSGVSPDVSAFVTRLVDAINEKKTAKLDLELGSSLSASADVDYAESGTAMSLSVVTGTQTTRVVLTGNEMYVQQTKGSKYLKIGKDDPALGSLLGQLGGFGPKSALESLKPGITKLQDKGEETVDGLALEHYLLVVDSKKAKAIFGVPQGSAKTPARVSYNLWVDGDDLVRQVKMTVNGQNLVMKVSDWGKPVTIKAPPASQVFTR